MALNQYLPTMYMHLTKEQGIRLVNGLIAELSAPSQEITDAKLAEILGVKPPVISKIRHGNLPAGDNFQLRAMVVTGKTYTELARLWE